MVQQVDWKAENDPNATWGKMVSCTNMIVKDILGESRSGITLYMDTSWWNKEVKTAIKLKQNSYKNFKNKNGVSFQRY